MGIIFYRTLKCEKCGFEYRGKYGGHIISKGEHYDISQYSCNTCHSIIDLEHHSSLRENKEKYFYPDGTEVSYDIEKTKSEESDAENGEFISANNSNDTSPACQKCGNRLLKINIESGEYAVCPKCGQKSLKQKNIHVDVYVD